MDSKDMFFEALCDALHLIYKVEMRSRRIKDWNEDEADDADRYIKSMVRCLDQICENLSLSI